MPHTYAIEVVKDESIFSLPGSWQDADFRGVLEALEFADRDSIPNDELLDMVVMALEEVGFQKAGEAVMGWVMSGDFSAGQIQNTVGKLAEEKLWERHRLVALQNRFFDVGWMMHRAFPGSCKKPVGLSFCLEVRSTSAGIAALVEDFDKTKFLRLLSVCMDDSFIVNRVYGDQLATGSGSEAEGIVWTMDHHVGDDQLTVTFISNSFWLKDLTQRHEFSGEL